MFQPQGFEKISAHDLMCELKKAIYRLKQALRARFYTLSSLLKFWFQCCKVDTSIFTQFVDTKITILLMCMDDNILAGNDADYFKDLTLFLNSCFTLKDLGYLSYFLGIRIKRAFWYYTYQLAQINAF